MFSDTLVWWFSRQIVQPRWYGLFRHIFKFSLRGMGVLNSGGNDATGEDWFLSRAAIAKVRCVVDVGANLAIYGEKELSGATIVAFEPHPQLVAQLRAQPHRSSVQIIAQAVSHTNGSATLWDFAPDAPLKHTQPTSTLASLNKSVIEGLHGQKAMGYQVKTVTLDSALSKLGVRHVDILKIDVEGLELAVLQGAKRLLAAHAIDLIQFEFNEMHAYQHVLFKDFVDILPDFDFYRLSAHGLIPLGPYRPLTHELFGFQNVLAISHKKRAKWLRVLS